MPFQTCRKEQKDVLVYLNPAPRPQEAGMAQHPLRVLHVLAAAVGLHDLLLLLPAPHLQRCLAVAAIVWVAWGWGIPGKEIHHSESGSWDCEGGFCKKDWNLQRKPQTHVQRARQQCLSVKRMATWHWGILLQATLGLGWVINAINLTGLKEQRACWNHGWPTQG